MAEVFPDLVVYDEKGRPFTVKYHLLSSMLMNELQKLAELWSTLKIKPTHASWRNYERDSWPSNIGLHHPMA